MFFLKGQASALDYGNLARNIQALKVLRSTDARHHHIGELCALLPVQQLKREIMPLNILIGNGLSPSSEACLRAAVDAGDGQRRRIAGSGTDDAVIRIGGQRVISIGRGVRGGIGIARRAVQQNARCLYGSVIAIEG